MSGQPLRPRGDLAALCFGDDRPTPAERRLVARALARASARADAAEEVTLPADLLQAALRATAAPPRSMERAASPRSMERAAAGLVRGSAWARWLGLAAGIAGFCLVSLLVVRPLIQSDRGAPASAGPAIAARPDEPSGNSGSVQSEALVEEARRLVVTPLLRDSLRRYLESPADAAQDVSKALPPGIGTPREFAISEGLAMALRTDAALPAIRAERIGSTFRLSLPDEIP